MITYKNEQLPASKCPHRPERIPIDFSSESLHDKLSALPISAPVIVVIERVFMYLTEGQIQELLRTLRMLWPEHRLVCDLMTQKFISKYARTAHDKIKELGAQFVREVDDHEELFRAAGYHPLEKHSVVARAIELGTLKIPRFIVRFFLRSLANGYVVYVFDPRLRGGGVN